VLGGSWSLVEKKKEIWAAVKERACPHLSRALLLLYCCFTAALLLLYEGLSQFARESMLQDASRAFLLLV